MLIQICLKVQTQFNRSELKIRLKKNVNNLKIRNTRASTDRNVDIFQYGCTQSNSFVYSEHKAQICCQIQTQTDLVQIQTDPFSIKTHNDITVLQFRNAENGRIREWRVQWGTVKERLRDYGKTRVSEQSFCEKYGGKKRSMTIKKECCRERKIRKRREKIHEWNTDSLTDSPYSCCRQQIQLWQWLSKPLHWLLPVTYTHSQFSWLKQANRHGSQREIMRENSFNKN